MPIHPSNAGVGSRSMRTALIAILLCAASLVFPCARAQQTEALSKQFLNYKAKAEQGDARSRFNQGLSYAFGEGVGKD